MSFTSYMIAIIAISAAFSASTVHAQGEPQGKRLCELHGEGANGACKRLFEASHYRDGGVELAKLLGAAVGKSMTERGSMQAGSSAQEMQLRQEISYNEQAIKICKDFQKKCNEGCDTAAKQVPEDKADIDVIKEGECGSRITAKVLVFEGNIAGLNKDVAEAIASRTPGRASN